MSASYMMPCTWPAVMIPQCPDESPVRVSGSPWSWKVCGEHNKHQHKKPCLGREAFEVNASSAIKPQRRSHPGAGELRVNGTVVFSPCLALFLSDAVIYQEMDHDAVSVEEGNGPIFSTHLLS